MCYLTWHQGFRAPDDCEEYVVEAKPGDKSCDGTPAFPVYTAPPVPVSVPTFEKWCELTEQKPVGWVRDAMKEAYDACRAAMLHSAEPVSQAYKLNALDGNSPVTPDGWVMVPKRLTAENGAKGVLSGEFSETTFISCPECFGDDDCETCDCSGRIEIKVPVSWTTIKTIWAKGCEHFSIVAPQQDG
ncbi:TPA: hypothetical protein ACQ70F_003494 [Escherichia coli]|uniref:hypothetical protein n=1 Tax=Escherichia coli TaxID=562 RepID=UPI00384E8482